MQSNPVPTHTMTLTGRSTATLTGVEDVDCFNEQIVVLRTPLGMLTLTGEGLNISQLSLNDGRLVVEGDIVSCHGGTVPPLSVDGRRGRRRRHAVLPLRRTSAAAERGLLADPRGGRVLRPRRCADAHRRAAAGLRRAIAAV